MNRRRAFCLGLFTLAGAPGLREAGAASGTAAQRMRPAMLVDRAWGGTGILYDAVASGPIVHVAYYDEQRALCVARVDTTTGQVSKQALDSTFVGWDSHNGVTLEVDRWGHVHVAGNMHTDRLVYGRTTTPGDLASLTLLNRMVGEDERRVTYPRFLRTPLGELFFVYRSGRSGDGVHWINRFDGTRWHRVAPQPLFAADRADAPVSAYPTEFMRGPDGRYHVAWVWRRPGGVEHNVDVLYARSADLVHWEGSDGIGRRLPLTPSSAEAAVRVPPGRGLMNNVKLGFDAAGRPVVSFVHHDDDGSTQLYHARPGPDGWSVVAASAWTHRWETSGRGSFSGGIGFSGVRVDGGFLVEDVVHARLGRHRLRLDPATLSPMAPPAAPPAAARGAGDARVPPPFVSMHRRIRAATPDAVRGTLRWLSLGSGNEDRPRSCASVGLPPDCRMSGPMELDVSTSIAAAEEQR